VCDEIDDLTDAIIEDTCHCDLCGRPFLLGAGSDYVIIDVDGPGTTFGRIGPQLKLCCFCAKLVHDAYRENLHEAGICAHGVNDGDWCEDCNAEYKRARTRKEDCE
jgi:hypothetical protein